MVLMTAVPMTSTISYPDLYMHFKILHSEFDEPELQRPHAAYSILSQNVRGFTHAARRIWLSSWRKSALRFSISLFFIQETHLRSQQEVDEIEQIWKELWNYRGTSPVIYCSITERAAAGVAILVDHPTPTSITQSRSFVERSTDSSTVTG